MSERTFVAVIQKEEGFYVVECLETGMYIHYRTIRQLAEYTGQSVMQAICGAEHY
jgi:hypothetical protein